MFSGYFFRCLWRKKSIWVKPGRTDQWWQNLFNDKLSEEDWKKNLRMWKSNFLKLVDLIKPYAKERSSRVRKDVICLEKKVAVTLYYLKDQDSMQMTSNTFGIARCTVGQVVKEIWGILSKDLGPVFIKFMLKKMRFWSLRFNSNNDLVFLRRSGVLMEPTFQLNNRPRILMIIILWIVKLFVMLLANLLMLRWNGHDARVFANRDIQKAFADEKMKLFYKELVPGEECVPQVLLGDPAYPLLTYVMKEFEHCKSNDEIIFNQMLRSARNQIELLLEG